MEKPSIVIFSSEQGLSIAKEIRSQLGNSSYAEAWLERPFYSGDYPLGSLINTLESKDYAVIVMTSDDLTIAGRDLASLDVNNVSNEALPSPCDNVVFELGLSIGILGRERTFLVRDRNPGLKLPTDLAGFNDLDMDVGYACSQIKEVTSKFGLRLESPRIQPISQISDRYLRSFGASIVGSTAAGIESLINNEAARMPETQYLEHLITEISDLSKDDVLLAICGGKNYSLSEVYSYLNENIQLARDRGVLVHRLYVAPEEVFLPDEWEVVEAHLTWAENLPMFKVGVLWGKENCKKLLELKLPHKFGMVLTRHRGHWKSRIHYGLDDKQQGGWEFRNEAIILKQRKLFEDLSQLAARIGIPLSVRKIMNRKIKKLKEPRLWRYGEERPI